MRRLAPWLALLAVAALAVGCALPDRPPPAGVDPGEPTPDLRAAQGVGTDEDAVEACLACHLEIGDRWVQLSSHSLTLDCTICHEQLSSSHDVGHAAIPSCSDCHTQDQHPLRSLCVDCHDPHGSPNLLLIQEWIYRPDGTPVLVALDEALGVGEGGLASGQGEGEAGGLCEVCHAETVHYRADGEGHKHFEAWCAACHRHGAGFEPVGDPFGLGYEVDGGGGIER